MSLTEPNFMKEEMYSIEDIRKGNVKAFESFFESFYVYLCQISFSYLKDLDASRDIAQDAFIYFWERRNEIYSIHSAKLYLYKYVKNRSLNYIRNTKLRTNIIEERQSNEVAFEDNQIEQETYRLIYSAIKTLPPQGKKIIEHSLDGLSNNEIAIEMNISVNTIKTLKKRAYIKLREEIKRNFLITLFFIRSFHATLRQSKVCLINY